MLLLGRIATAKTLTDYVKDILNTSLMSYRYKLDSIQNALYPYGFFRDPYIVGYMFGICTGHLSAMLLQGQTITGENTDDITQRVLKNVCGSDAQQAYNMIGSKMKEKYNNEYNIPSNDREYDVAQEPFNAGLDHGTILMHAFNGSLKSDSKIPMVVRAREIARDIHETDQYYIHNKDNNINTTSSFYTSSASSDTQAIMLETIMLYVEENY